MKRLGQDQGTGTALLGRSSAASRFLRAAVLSALTLSPGAAGAASIVTDWLDIALPTAEAVAPKPPAGARFFAVLQTAIYDAWAAYDPVATGVVSGRSLAGTGSAPSELARREAISHAAYTVLMHFAPTRHRTFKANMAELGYDPKSTSPDAVLGRKAAQAVIEQRDQDGSNMEDRYTDTTGYAPRDPAVPDAWQPATEEIANTMAFLPMTPHWGLVTPFGLTSMDEFRPPAPPAFGTPEFDAQIKTVLDFSAGLDDREKAIAEFWANFISTPAVQLMSMTKTISLREDMRTEADVKLFFIVANTMFNSSVAAWDAKYHYDYLRPYTAIRNLGSQTVHAWNSPNRTVTGTHLPNEGTAIAWGVDQGAVDMPASEWLPYLPTPPFPAYISGHSTFCAAWAVAMEQATGSDRFDHHVTWPKLFVESRWLDTPVTLDYPTYASAVEDCGLSRLYGGVHWPVDNDEGLALGRAVGARTWQQAQRYFTGAAKPAWAVVSTPGVAMWHHEPPQGTGVSLHNDDGLQIAFDRGAGADTERSGRWTSPTFDALPAGLYQVRATVSVESSGQTEMHPQLKAQLYKSDGTMIAEALFAPDGTDALDLNFATDGASPLRLVLSGSVRGAAPMNIRFSALQLMHVTR